MSSDSHTWKNPHLNSGGCNARLYLLTSIKRDILVILAQIQVCGPLAM